MNLPQHRQQQTGEDHQADDAVLHDRPYVLTVHSHSEVLLEGIRVPLAPAEHEVDRLERAQVVMPLFRPNARGFADRAGPSEYRAGERAVAGAGEGGRLFDELRGEREPDTEQRNEAWVRQNQIRPPIDDQCGNPGA